jgi:uncharacterized damage-inducible protein DinB
MEKMPSKTGRPRKYGLPPLPGFASPELAAAAAWMQELAARVYDQIEDLPPEALDFTPADTRLSIGRLVAHLAWAEATWVSRITGQPIPEGLTRQVEAGALAAFDKAPGPAGTAAELIAFCRRVQESFTAPALSRIVDAGAALEAGGRRVNARGVVAQLQWHWIYHSGQIGLLRLLWGSDYQWTNEAILG